MQELRTVPQFRRKVPAHHGVLPGRGVVEEVPVDRLLGAVLAQEPAAQPGQCGEWAAGEERRLGAAECLRGRTVVLDRPGFPRLSVDPLEQQYRLLLVDAGAQAVMSVEVV